MPVGEPAGPGTGTRMYCSVMASHLANSDGALIMQNASLIPSRRVRCHWPPVLSGAAAGSAPAKVISLRPGGTGGSDEDLPSSQLIGKIEPTSLCARQLAVAAAGDGFEVNRQPDCWPVTN